MEVGKLKEEN